MYYKTVLESVSIYTVDGVALAELIAVIIGNEASEELCRELAKLTTTRLFSISEQELMLNYGLKLDSARRLAAALRMQAKLRTGFPSISGPGDAYDQLRSIAYEEQENFVVLYLNTKNQVTKKEVITRGSMNASIVHPREIFKRAIRESAASIVVAHNHPSGDPTPSREDAEVTKRIVESGKLLGIEVIDHIIVGGDSYYSFKEQGEM